MKTVERIDPPQQKYVGRGNAECASQKTAVPLRKNTRNGALCWAREKRYGKQSLFRKRRRVQNKATIAHYIMIITHRQKSIPAAWRNTFTAAPASALA